MLRFGCTAPYRWQAPRFRLAVCLLALWALACAREAPLLIGVTEVNPSVVEAQDTLTVVGEGFAEGARGKVCFAGTLFRAGQAPQTGVTISGAGSAVSRERLRLGLSSSLIAEFCGEKEPVHTTFEGSVTVTFPPKTPGAPLVSGRVAQVRLDVYPSPEQITQAFEPDAVRGFWGAELARPEEGDGLLVSHINPEAAVGRLGLVAGDSIVRFDGLTVRSLSDIVPYPGQRSAKLSVQRRQGAIVQFPLDVSGFAPLPASGWALGASVCAALALLLLLSRSPLGRFSVWLETQAAARTPDAGLRLSSQTPPRAPKTALHLFAFLAASALFVLLQFRLFRVVADIDLVILYLLSVLLLGLKQLWLGGLSGPGWSLWRAFRATSRGILTHTLLLLCLVPAVASAGSLSIRELVRNQSDALLTLNLFETPSDYFAGVCLLFTLGMSLMSGVDRPEHGRLGRFAATLAAQLEAFRLLIGAGLFVCLYGGGWAWPPAFAELENPLYGALLFQTKLTAVYLFLSWCRQGLPVLSDRYLQGYKFKILLPISLAAAVLSPAWTVEVWPEWLHQSVALMFAWLSCGVVCLLFLRQLRRLRDGAGTVALNPWL